MKNRLFIILLTIIITFLSGGFERLLAQNYWSEYPISIVTQNNGSQQRLELSTYDSTLQTTVTAYTQWITGYYFFSTANGKLTFITYLNPGQQTSRYGFGIYDFVLHQFNIKELDIPIITNRTLNVAANQYWVVSAYEDEYSSNSFFLTPTYHKYSMVTHQWSSVNMGYSESTYTPQIWNLGAPNNIQWIYYIEDTDEGEFYHYNPLAGRFAFFYSGCAGWYYEIDEEHFAVDGSCSDNYSYVSLDPELNWQGTPLFQTTGELRNGIFTANNQWLPHFPQYIFTYDIGIHQMIYDSTTNLTAGPYVVKDRVASYSVSSNGTSPMIYFLVHDPLQHAWVKDSAVTTGLVIPTIINGTVHWTDANGPHIRGYDVTTGWGNYTTPLFMYFHLSDFSNTEGVPLVHVRNYSIGKEQFYFDMGDGVVSTVRNNLWHLYDQPGPYNICMYEASGVQSVCQSDTFNLCGLPGIISANVDSVCIGGQVDLNLSGFQGDIQWQFSTNSNNWQDITTTGFDSSAISLNPVSSSYYRAKVIDGTCNPIYSAYKFVFVSTSTAGTIASATTAACIGQEIVLHVANYNGTLRWEKNSGVGWTVIPNATGGFLTDVLSVNTEYRVLSSPVLANCPADTSQIIQVNALPLGIISPLTGVNICGQDTVLLSANGTGVFQWYSSNVNGAPIINTGSTYSPFVSSTTTYYVSSLAGAVETAGLADTSVGVTSTGPITGRGLRVVSSEPGYLESITLYPMSAGNITVSWSLDNLNLGSVLYNISTPGISVEIPLGFKLNANQNYDLKFSSSSINFVKTAGGFSYPIVNPLSSLIILGRIINGYFYTDSSFYTGYNIVFSKGCKSLREPVTVQHTPEIVGTLTALGPTTFCQGQSVVLAAAPTGSGNAYKWYRGDSLISNATGSNYTATISGLYSAQIYNAVCSDTTSSIRVRIPCISTFDPEEKSITDEFAESNFNVFYQSIHQQLVLKCEALSNSISKVVIYDLNGRLIKQQSWTIIEGTNSINIDVANLNAGSYIVKWINSERTVVTKWVKHQ
ncbi:MAG: T9SS type A sorting domain-containing protein [Bacteroidetes bacterium]|nr:T9SS type A sorting domain-containing protein [Bacteroidota bacterium]